MQQEARIDRQARLSFAGISAETTQVLSEFWHIAKPQLPTILDGFYRHVATVPDLARRLGTDVVRLKSAQGSHWERLFSGRFDDEYFDSVRHIGLVHNRIGLEPRWYIGGYNFVLSALTDLAIRTYRLRPGKAQAAIRAANAAVMLDMDVAISVYQDSLLTDRAARGVRVDALLQVFEGKAADMVAHVAAAASQLQATAQTMAGIGQAANRQTSDMATAAEQASGNVQTVAASAEQLSASVNEISRQVAQSAKIAGRAVEDADRTNDTVRRLAEAAQRIGAVVNLISQIAGQTNLLALNATIEAARAGDAGKGFAVVAAEVKNLAAQTAKATDEIGDQVGRIQASVREAVSSIQAIGATIGEMHEIATAIAVAVEEQGAATQEIARSVQEAAQGTQAVASNIDGISQSVAQTNGVAEEVLGAATGLTDQSNLLNAEVRRFVSDLKAA